MTNFSIIIPNFNGEKLLPECLATLISAIKNSSKSEYELILVDNGSIDNSKKVFQNFLHTSKLNYQIISNPKNLGFAAAVNQGILKSKHQWVAVLNNDIKLNKNWFKIISTAIPKNKKICAIFGTILDKTGKKIESQGLEYFKSGKALNINNDKAYHPSMISDLPPTPIWGAPAALIIYKKNIIKKIGLFDEDFFAYEEDVDLSIRINLFGYKTIYIPQAISFHLGGGTSNHMGNLRSYMDTKNWVYILIKYYSFKELLKHLGPILFERLKNFSYLITDTIKKYRFKSFIYLPFSLTKMLFEIIFKLPKLIKKRRQLQKLLQFNQYQ